MGGGGLFDGVICSEQSVCAYPHHSPALAHTHHNPLLLSPQYWRACCVLVISLQPSTAWGCVLLPLGSSCTMFTSIKRLKRGKWHRCMQAEGTWAPRCVVMCGWVGVLVFVWVCCNVQVAPSMNIIIIHNNNMHSSAHDTQLPTLYTPYRCTHSNTA